MKIRYTYISLIIFLCFRYFDKSLGYTRLDQTNYKLSMQRY